MPSRTRVPFNDLSRQLKQEGQALNTIFRDVLESGWLIHGPNHRAFELEFAGFVGTNFAVGVGSGTDALELALRAIRSSQSDKIITAANAGGYATIAAHAAGFGVDYCEVSEETHCLDPSVLPEVLDERVRAVVVTHLYGRVADVAAIREVCSPRGILVIEDCAQAVGARASTGMAGALGDIGCFSFYPTKNLGALGDAGALTTNSPDLAEALRSLRQYGWGERYHVQREDGRNSRLDELQAAVLRYRLPFVSGWNQHRRSIIAHYRDAASERLTVLPALGEDHSGHLAVCATDHRSDLIDHLTRLGIDTAIHYPVPDTEQHPCSALRRAVPITHKLAGMVLSLPCFPQLGDAEVARVCDALESF